MDGAPAGWLSWAGWRFARAGAPSTRVCVELFVPLLRLTLCVGRYDVRQQLERVVKGLTEQCVCLRLCANHDAFNPLSVCLLLCSILSLGDGELI